MTASPRELTHETAPGELPAEGFDVPEETLALFKSELEPGERLLWAGQSKGRRDSNSIRGLLIATVLFLGSLAVCAVCVAIVRKH
jgi:hypothetical protein